MNLRFKSNKRTSFYLHLAQGNRVIILHFVGCSQLHVILKSTSYTGIIKYILMKITKECIFIDILKKKINRRFENNEKKN